MLAVSSFGVEILSSPNFSACASGLAKGFMKRSKGKQKGQEGQKKAKRSFCPFCPSCPFCFLFT
jgi:hypothetical protein